MSSSSKPESTNNAGSHRGPVQSKGACQRLRRPTGFRSIVLACLFDGFGFGTREKIARSRAERSESERVCPSFVSSVCQVTSGVHTHTHSRSRQSPNLKNHAERKRYSGLLRVRVAAARLRRLLHRRTPWRHPLRTISYAQDPTL